MPVIPKCRILRELLICGRLELHGGTLFQNKNKNVSKPLGEFKKHGQYPASGEEMSY